MMRYVMLIVLGVAGMAYGQTTRISSADAQVKESQRAVDEARENWNRVRERCIADLHKSDAYLAAVRDRDAKRAGLESARRGGTAQQKVDASGAYLATKKAVEEMDDEIELNETLLAAERHGVNAKVRLAAAEMEARSARAEWEAIPAIERNPRVGLSGRFEDDVRIVQIVDGNNALVTCGRPTYESLVWLSGWPTKDLIDGQYWRIGGRVSVKTTRRYKSADGGTKTVPEIVPAETPTTNATASTPPATAP
jgi:hypothetical protein